MTDKKTSDSQDVLEDLDRNSKINTVIDKMGNNATDPASNQQANVEYNIIRKGGDTHHDVNAF